MPVELSGITLQHLTHVSVRERARIVHHPVPGMSGDLVQTLGRPSVEVSFRGIFYGANIADELNQLRSAYLENKPVDFFTEAIGEGYFTQVLIVKLEASQRTGYLDQFDFICEVVEYVEPPEPVAANPFAALDAGLLDEATSFIDDAQNVLEQVSQLTELLGVVPDFGNPTEALVGILDEYKDIAGEAAGNLATIDELF
jgi:DNA circularisation protein N-terminus